MADLSITVSNIMKVKYAVVDDQPSQWGTMVWGTGFWWGDFDTTIQFEKWVSESITATQTMDKRVLKLVGNTVALTESTGAAVTKGFFETISLGTTVSAYVTQGNWTRDEPDLATWTAADAGSTTWTPAVAASTTWS